VRTASLLGRPLGTVDMASVGHVVSGHVRNSNAGTAVASGDVTGDGVPDLIVGASAHTGAPTTSAVYVVQGPTVADASTSGALVSISSVTQLDHLGMGVEVADLNDDGHGDLVVAAPGWQGTGGVFVYFGPLAGGALTLDDADVTIVGSPGSRLGSVDFDAVHGWDSDGDGVDELWIGAPLLHDAQGVATGGVLRFDGPLAAGVYGSGDADAAVMGAVVGGSFGASLALLGDVDGDGVDELAVGAPREVRSGTGAGVIYVVDVPVSGVSLSGGDVVLAPGAGVALQGAGDADGDGYADLFGNSFPSSGGQVCLWLGGPGR
jgi:hypothetical protein